MTDIYDDEAERALLGACIISELAIEDAIHLVEPGDFHATKHQAIYAAALTVHASDARLDAVTIHHAIQGADVDLAQLHELQNATPTISNAARYATRIADAATRRRLAWAATDITALAHGRTPSHDAADAAEQARAILAGIDMPAGRGAPDPDIDTFISSVDTTYDWLIPDFLERRDRMLITASEGAGKALAASTPIPTPSGWTTMGELVVGDTVFGVDGQPCTVLAVTDTWWGNSYRIAFSDGASIVADADHRWLTETLRAREAAAAARRRPAKTKPRGTDQRWRRVDFPALVTTADIRRTLRARNGHALNHSVAPCAPINCPTADLPISPYTFGAWLGDGTSRTAAITCADGQILDEIRSEGWTVTKAKSRYLWRIKGGRVRDGFEARIRRLDVWCNKHIPAVYRRASADQRLAVLQGLMDTDGHIETSGACEITLMSKQLAFDVFDLLLGLGVKATIRESDARLHGRTVGTRYRIGFVTQLPVFRLARKADRLRPLRTRRGALRYITAVDPVPSVPVRCIQVDRPDGMFLAGEHYIPTHNSYLLTQLGTQIASGIHPWTLANTAPRNVLIVDLENSARLVTRRLDRLRRQAATLDPQRLRIHTRPGGIDLTTRTDRRWLTDRCQANNTELLIIGPAYRMSAGVSQRGDIGGEDQARTITKALDDIRERCDVALLMETHAPHAGTHGRDLRPFGSSVWLRWPEFGIGLAADIDDRTGNRYRVTHWRGPRDERIWPVALLRNAGRWPWTPEMPTGTFRRTA